MYGKKVGYMTHAGGIIRPSLYIETSDGFGNVISKNIDIVQEAYSCCGDSLPKYGQPNEVWVCLICDRVWIARTKDSWSLTRLFLSSQEERDRAAWDSYRLWKLGVSLFAASIVISAITALFGTRILNIPAESLPASVIGFSVFAIGITATLAVFHRWWKRVKDYTLSIPAELVQSKA